MAKKRYAIRIKQEGKGKPETEVFSDLDAAREFVRERWAGAEYIDSTIEFHTDYSTYRLIGFTLNDIGKIIFNHEDCCREYRFGDEPTPMSRPDDNGDYCSTYYTQTGQ